MKAIVLCFFIIASLAVNLVELYEYDSNANSQGPVSRPDVSLVGKVITRRNAPDYFKTSLTEDAQLETQRNKRHIPGFHSPLVSTHFYHPAAPIATYPVAAPIPMVEETPYLPAYHYSPYGAYASPYGSPYGAHAVI